MTIDKTWEAWGEQEPYYAVLTDERFRSTNFDAAQRQAFFASGEQYVATVLRRYREQLGTRAQYNNVLDFGCGVGRLLMPLAKQFNSATGVDVSRAMLGECHHNCDANGLSNVRLLPTNEFTNAATVEHYDLVHSALVIQHINPRSGEKLIAHMLKQLRVGGMVSLQVTSADRWWVYAQTFLKYQIPGVQRLYRVIRGKPDVASMHMYPYNVSRVLGVFSAHGVPRVNVTSREIGPYRSVTLSGIKVEGA